MGVFLAATGMAGFMAASFFAYPALAWSPSMPSGFSVIGHGVDSAPNSTCPEFYSIKAPNGAIESHVCDQGTVDAFVSANSSPSAPQTDPATTTTATTTIASTTGATTIATVTGAAALGTTTTAPSATTTDTMTTTATVATAALAIASAPQPLMLCRSSVVILRATPC